MRPVANTNICSYSAEVSSPDYAELHCHSNFSFLDGASHPEELIDEAARLELSGLALTDHNGFYGSVRFALAARNAGMPSIFGAELTLDLAEHHGDAQAARRMPDPPGRHLLILSEGAHGYARLARALSHAHMSGEKTKPHTTLETLADAACAGTFTSARTNANTSWFVLTGCRKGTVPAALLADGPFRARRELDRLIEAFGRERVLVELWDHSDPIDRHRNDALAKLAMAAHVEVVATNNVHYATPAHRNRAHVLAAIRTGRSLDELDGWLPPAPFAHLRSATEQLARFARWPGAVERTAEIAAACAFDLALAAPNLPDCPTPEGHTEMSWLAELTRRGAARVYPSTHPDHAKAHQQLAHELAVIEHLGFAGYFLIVFDIVEFCRKNNILCQGRGSAANSAVCYALGITKADAVALGLLFERFLSPERDGPPDIDVDIEHARREEVIQYVYERYGRDRAAQVANVITYRGRSAIREVGKACGLSPGAADALARATDRWGSNDAAGHGGWTRGPAREERPYAELTEEVPGVPPLVVDIATDLLDFPRHLGIHSGGMVLVDRPLIEFGPVEWARKEGRSVLQWDKDDCAAAGLVKFDLLGLGMLTMLHLAFDLIAEHDGVEVDLATIPQEDEVYDLLCSADTIGVFQVESRAQMATLPRLRPRTFYDLVIEVALIRPGPIQGKSVHPYLRRRAGKEAITYPHPLAEPALRKTLGVPLFQEQLMQLAIDVAGFSPGDADQLRQAMAAKRSKARMAVMRERLMAGMAERGIPCEAAEEIASKLEAFADFGFPESHSVSFAYLVYASAWVKRRFPAAFAAALLNAQPMGFYAPHTIVRDAVRHGVEVLSPCIARSRRECTLEARSANAGPVGEPHAGWHADPSTHAVRIGLRYVRGCSDTLLERIDIERAQRPFADLEDFTRRTEAPIDALEALATAGAFECFGQNRRASLWVAGAVAATRPRTRRGVTTETLPGIVVGKEAPTLPGMSPAEELTADLWATGLSARAHPTELIRAELADAGIVTAADLKTLTDRSVVEVAGIVTHRQQPGTAKGVVFLNLEDETGLINVICTPGLWKRSKSVARRTPALRVRGVLERHDGVINLLAHQVRALPLRVGAVPGSRDFR